MTTNQVNLIKELIDEGYWITVRPFNLALSKWVKNLKPGNTVSHKRAYPNGFFITDTMDTLVAHTIPSNSLYIYPKDVTRKQASGPGKRVFDYHGNPLIVTVDISDVDEEPYIKLRYYDICGVNVAEGEPKVGSFFLKLPTDKMYQSLLLAPIMMTGPSSKIAMAKSIDTAFSNNDFRPADIQDSDPIIVIPLHWGTCTNSPISIYPYSRQAMIEHNYRIITQI